MAAVDHPPQEKVDEKVKIQLPGFVGAFGSENLHMGPSASCFVKVHILTFSKHPGTLESGKYS